MACAQTGTGKTAAFALPLLQLMHTNQKNNPGQRNQPIKVLILTPTRELAIQIEDSFKVYGKYLQFKTLSIFGGVSQFTQVRSLRQGVDILVATPGRLLDLLNQRQLSLQHIQYLVVDEADRMLDMGFVQDVKRIIGKLPTQRQTLFFSATMSPEIQQLASTMLKEPVRIKVTPPGTTVDLIQQYLYYVEKHNKRSLLTHLLEDKAIITAIVFARTKHGADNITRHLTKAGIRAEAIHGGRSQNSRQSALHNFKTRRTRILVATDIAARGIDIDDLTHVINFELPNVPETYVHRIGRTGRAGTKGVAISFCDYEEKMFLREIQQLTRKIIPVVTGHAFDAPLMHAKEQVAGKTAPISASPFKKGRRRTFMQRA